MASKSTYASEEKGAEIEELLDLLDKLVDRVIFARDRTELEAATRALDRVLLWNQYVVPQFTRSDTWTARWDRFGRPDKLPAYGSSGFPDIWWFDEAKAKRVGGKP